MRHIGRTAAFALFLALSAAAFAQGGRPVVSNGGFEQLGPNGFPVDWEPVGREVGVSRDAHSGQYSLRLVRRPDTPTRETGVNRAWRAFSGEQGKMIPSGKGAVRFWYKAISADRAQLNIYIIPMSKKPLEDTGEPRVTFTVPQAHIGDGKWHMGALAYDFTRAPKVKWLHVAARIVGRAGELLLDDFQWLESVGPILQVQETQAFEPLERGVVELRAKVRNVGDRALAGATVRLVAPQGVRVEPAGEQPVAELPPGEQQIVRWRIFGAAPPGSVARVVARAGEQEAEDALELAPRVRWLAAAFPSVVEQGAETTITLLARNRGSAASPAAPWTLRGPALRIEGSGTRQVAPLAPGEERAVRWKARAVGAPGVHGALLRCAAGEEELSLPVGLVVLPKGAGEEGSGDAIVSWGEGKRLRFVRLPQGFGPAAVEVREGEAWRPIAWLAWLGRARFALGDGRERATVLYGKRVGPGEFRARFSGPGGSRWVYSLEVKQEPKTGALGFFAQLAPERGGGEVRIEGPAVLAGEGSFGLAKDEALFCGLEWLEGEEISSSDLDIAEDHPDRPRFEPHPTKITVPCMAVRGGGRVLALLWPAPRMEGGVLRQLGASFCSPDYLNGRAAHRMQVFAPAPERDNEPNFAPLSLGRGLELEFYLWLSAPGARITDAVAQWYALFGVPPPNPLPRKSYPAEIAFSMEAYLKTLWDEREQRWRHHLGGPKISDVRGYFPSFVYDLMRGAQLAADEATRQRCRRRLAFVLSKRKIAPAGANDLGLWRGKPVAQVEGVLHAALRALAARRADGSWRFDADRVDRGVFRGRDYRELGPDEALELGTCARQTYALVRAALVLGDERLFAEARKSLELMKKFTVPRAAQVWEVPVHTPDILAAADAVDAYVEAYRFSGERQYLEEAKRWAWAGLPFLYVWDLPDRPFLKYASIPVFGATWYRGSWFGRAVQWNGLRYANAVLKLAQYDRSFPWRTIAEGVTRSAIWQQATEGRTKALWPDSISARDGSKSSWVFSPQQLLALVYQFIGRGGEPQTVILRLGGERVHLTTRAQVRAARAAEGRLEVALSYREGEQGYSLLSGLAEPKQVLLDGEELPRAADVTAAEGSAWQYYQPRAMVVVKLAQAGRHTLAIAGARPRPVSLVAEQRRTISFEFEATTEGWSAAHDVLGLSARRGALVGSVIGGDPYIVRPGLRVAGDSVRVLRLRMLLTGGERASVYWTTASSPLFAEDKVVNFAVAGDGQWHEYRLAVGEHPKWRGETITALRIDPNNGPTGSLFAIDYVRGEK